MNGVLRGEKVILREKRLSDALDDYRWRVDEELARLDATTPLRMRFEEFLRFYAEELRYPSPWSRRFAIDTLEGLHIGNCMYYDIDYLRCRTELGILIGDKRYWGQGYGSDAVRTLLHHIFTATPITCVYLHTLEWNIRAQRAFEKCGFTPVRLVRRAGQTFVYMEIHKEDWERSRQARATQAP